MSLAAAAVMTAYDRWSCDKPVAALLDLMRTCLAQAGAGWRPDAA